MGRTTSDLPQEMIESILLELPVKPLLRFKSVSKSWNSIISHPLFIRNYNSKPQNVLLRTTRSGLSLVKLEDGKLQTVKELKFPLIFPRYDYRFLCFSEYGAILINNDYHHDTCLLWNPSNEKTRTLLLPHHLDTCCSAICYDPAIDDFKVVALSDDSYAVYSCKNESWSNIKQHPHDIDFSQPSENSSGVSIDGAIYWLFRMNKNNCSEIIYYDPRDDRLKILLKPKDDHVQGRPLHSQLLYLGGRLCLYRDYGKVIRIWTKEKGIDNNLWKELTIIHNVHESIWSLHPVCFAGNKIGFQCKDGDDDKLFVYDPLDKFFEQVGEKLIGIRSLIPYRDHTMFLT